MSKIHKEVLSKHKIEILKKLVSYANEVNKNEVPLKILKHDINMYNNAQKLRYHALIFKVKRGTWGITSHGAKFLRGDMDLPKWVAVSDNRIVGKSSHLMNIKHAYQGSTIVDVTFDYYVDGVFVGPRPLGPPLRQARLV